MQHIRRWRSRSVLGIGEAMVEFSPIGGGAYRRGFAGDLRATGDVLIDQLVHMHRLGFTSAVLKEGKDPADAERQFTRFAAFYQGDLQVKQPLFARS